jgi:hypothetical protein
VQDAGHAAMPGAKVTVTNVATEVVPNDVTNAEGRFVVPYLLPSRCAVSMEMAGSARQKRFSAQCRLIAANATQTTRFGRPGSTVGHTSLAEISAVGVNPRSVQLAPRMFF